MIEIERHGAEAATLPVEAVQLELEMKVVWRVAAAIAVLTAWPSSAQTGAQHGHGTPAAKAVSTEFYNGEVRRINRETGRVTLAHGPLTGFAMPAMTMAFAVKDPKQLAALREGDKVKFALEQADENLVVTRIEAVK